MASATNWMLTLVIRKISKVKFWLFNIYASSRIQGKSKLWGELKRISSPLKHGSFIIFRGDFNPITDLDEKRGGVFPNKRIMNDFGDFISDMSLFYCKSRNGVFTWTNMRRDFSQIAERLDPFF